LIVQNKNGGTQTVDMPVPVYQVAYPQIQVPVNNSYPSTYPVNNSQYPAAYPQAQASYPPAYTSVYPPAPVNNSPYTANQTIELKPHQTHY